MQSFKKHHRRKYGVDRRTVHERLSKLLHDVNIPVLKTKGKKYAILSDFHLGDGKFSDDFRSNENCLLAALNFYFVNDYSIILLGDIEELWQFSLDEIIKRYDKSIYSKLRDFAKENRLYKVLGNHDLDWRDSPTTTFINNSLCKVTEALKMEDYNGNVSIILVHGHQGLFDSDVTSNISRIIVHVFKVVEPVAHSLNWDPDPSMTQCEVTEEYEKSYYEWAKENNIIIICGHSHRAIFASRNYVNKLNENIKVLQDEIVNNKNNIKLVENYTKKIKELNHVIKHEIKRNRDVEVSDSKDPVPCYFNTGCGVYKDGITAIEIADGIISLNKWSNKSPVRQDVPYDCHSLSDYVKQVKSGITLEK